MRRTNGTCYDVQAPIFLSHHQKGRKIRSVGDAVLKRHQTWGVDYEYEDAIQSCVF